MPSHPNPTTPHRPPTTSISSPSTPPPTPPPPPHHTPPAKQPTPNHTTTLLSPTCLQNSAELPLNGVFAVANAVDGKRHAWYSFTSHSSLGKADTYSVDIGFSWRVIALNADDVPLAVMLTPRARITSALCSCAAGLSGACWHIAFGLYVANNILRADEVLQSPTARLQRWNRPSGSAWITTCTAGVARAAFLSTRVREGGAVTMRANPAALAVGGRGALSPPAHTLPPRTDPRWTEPRAALHAAARMTNGGTASAAELWDMPLPMLQLLRDKQYAARLALAEADGKLHADGGGDALRAARRARSRKRRHDSSAPPASDDGGADAPEHAADASGAPNRPFFQRYPTLVIQDLGVQYPQAPSAAKPYLCKWCGWKANLDSHLDAGKCVKWEVGSGGAKPLSDDWQSGPSRRPHPRPDFIVPLHGFSFDTANPMRQKKRRTT